jgi:hypothetical protein
VKIRSIIIITAALTLGSAYAQDSAGFSNGNDSCACQDSSKGGHHFGINKDTCAKADTNAPHLTMNADHGNTSSTIASKGATLDCSPNPFNPAGKIRYTLPARSFISIKVYDMSGRLIRTIYSGTRQAGAFESEWQGDDNQGRHAPSGRYLMRLSSDESQIAISLFLVK